MIKKIALVLLCMTTSVCFTMENITGEDKDFIKKTTEQIKEFLGLGKQNTDENDDGEDDWKDFLEFITEHIDRKTDCFN